MKKVILFLFLFSCVSYSQLRKKVTATSTPMTSGQVQDSLNADSLVLTKPFSVGNGGVYLVNTWMDTMNVDNIVGGGIVYTRTKTIAGVALGDVVSVTPKGDEVDVGEQITPYGFVSALNTVKVIFSNPYAGASNINNYYFNIVVQRFVKP